MVRLHVNSSMCTGCMNCEAVCALSRSGRQDVEASAIRVELELFSGMHRIHWCRQCRDAPCAAACQNGAVHRNRITGAWVIDPDACTGCGSCVTACPFHAVFQAPDVTVPAKCDLCKGEPLCAEACAFGAITLREVME